MIFIVSSPFLGRRGIFLKNFPKGMNLVEDFAKGPIILSGGKPKISGGLTKEGNYEIIIPIFNFLGQ